jgi:hypothetical protein
MEAIYCVLWAGTAFTTSVSRRSLTFISNRNPSLLVFLSLKNHPFLRVMPIAPSDMRPLELITCVAEVALGEREDLGGRY